MFFFYVLMHDGAIIIIIKKTTRRDIRKLFSFYLLLCSEITAFTFSKYSCRVVNNMCINPETEINNRRLMNWGVKTAHIFLRKKETDKKKMKKK